VTRPITRAAWVVGGCLVVLLLLFVVFHDREEKGSGGPPAPESTPAQGSTPADVLVIAHRGASAYAPQNTVAAAREAVTRGADALEADIRQTRDGHLVALLDPTLARTTNVAEVKRLDAGSWFGPEFAGERVPTLSELADALDGTDVEMIVEVKAPRRYPGIGELVLREIRSRPGRYREVESFNLPFVRQFAQHSPPVKLGAAEAPSEEQLREVASYADAVNVQQGTVDAGYVDRAHRLGLEVKMWSLNTPEQVQRGLALDVDGIYSHRPDMVLEVLGR
jgi:glycerophosphoryl diester phosphodiesterase